MYFISNVSCELIEFQLRKLRGLSPGHTLRECGKLCSHPGFLTLKPKPASNILTRTQPSLPFQGYRFVANLTLPSVPVRAWVRSRLNFFNKFNDFIFAEERESVMYLDYFLLEHRCFSSKLSRSWVSRKCPTWALMWRLRQERRGLSAFLLELHIRFVSVTLGNFLGKINFVVPAPSGILFLYADIVLVKIHFLKWCFARLNHK